MRERSPEASAVLDGIPTTPGGDIARSAHGAVLYVGKGRLGMCLLFRLIRDSRVLTGSLGLGGATLDFVTSAATKHMHMSGSESRKRIIRRVAVRMSVGP